MLLDKLHYLSRGADVVVLAGSLPRGVSDAFYADVIRDLTKRGVRVVLDSEGEPMRLGVEAEPWLVSPNQREAEALVGQELEDDDDFLMALDRIADMGARNVHITHETGCFALVREERQTRRYRALSPLLAPVSTLGAGTCCWPGGWDAPFSPSARPRRCSVRSICRLTFGSADSWRPPWC